MRLVAVSEAETLTPMADLAGRWGITANTVSRRLSFLGIKPIRQGNYRFITSEQLALADELQQHILSGKPQDTFPRLDQPEGGLVARRVEAPAQVAGQVEQLAVLEAITTKAIATALANTKAPRAKTDPLKRAKLLAEAADLEWLSVAEIATVLGMSQKDVELLEYPHVPRPGYRLDRELFDGVPWFRVQRPERSTTSPTTSRSVGFLAEPPVAARQMITVSAVSLPVL